MSKNGLGRQVAIFILILVTAMMLTYLLSLLFILPNASKTNPTNDQESTVDCSVKFASVLRYLPDKTTDSCWLVLPFSKIKVVGWKAATNQVLFRYEECVPCTRGHGDYLPEPLRQHACPSPSYGLAELKKIRNWVLAEKSAVCNELYAGWLRQAEAVKKQLDK